VKVVCAWCGGEIGEKDGEGVDGISHTMCPRGFERLVSKAEAEDSGSGGDGTPAGGAGDEK